MSGHDGGEGRDERFCGTEEPEPVLIAPNKGRRLQARRVGERKLFNGERRGVFLEWFAGTGNLGWAAKKAGVHYRTVLRHRMDDEAFRCAYDAAEAQSLPRLKAWIVQARAEEEAALAAAGAGPADGAEDPEAEGAGAEEAGGDPSPELLSVEQAIRIVEAWEKRQAAARGGSGGGGGLGGPGGPGSAHAARTGRAPSVASNEEVRSALVRALAAHGVRVRGGAPAAGEAAKTPLHRPAGGYAQVQTAPGSPQPCRGHGGLCIPRPRGGSAVSAPSVWRRGRGHGGLCILRPGEDRS